MADDVKNNHHVRPLGYAENVAMKGEKKTGFWNLKQKKEVREGALVKRGQQIIHRGRGEKKRAGSSSK